MYFSSGSTGSSLKPALVSRYISFILNKRKIYQKKVAG